MRYIQFFLLLISSLSSVAQEARISETERPMTTYPYSDPDPVARPGRVYPLFRFDVFTNRPAIVDWHLVEMENDYIRLAIMPDMGGKVWEAYMKPDDFPFIFSGHSVKFRDVALRGPWTSDGLEFNFGDIGHATTTSTPVDYYTRINADGSVSCFIGATEWASRTTWRVEINLPPDKAYFTTRSWWYNGTPVEQEMYHWINAGFRAPGNLEFIFPGTHYIGHLGEYDTWPLDSLGRKISFYEHNNFGSMKSYHVLGQPTNFYGGFWHDYNMGFGHYSPYYEKLGKKAWSWGLSGEGLMWERLLTDTDGPNVELQSGRLFNQASRGSELTPFKHVGFAPYTVDSWTDYWFPVSHTRGLTSASPRGALNLREEGGWLKIDWMSLEDQSDTMKIVSHGEQLMVRSLKLKPLELFRDSLRWNGNIKDLDITLGEDILSDDPKSPSDRPLSAPADFDWKSEYGLYLKGADLSRQKNYKEAEQYLMESLEKNPDLIPALDRMAEIRYRQGLYEGARQYSGRALSVNTYDPEANYFWALSSEKLGNDTDAFDGYSVATLSTGFRRAAWLRLAYLSMKRKQWTEAETLISKCTATWPPDENALVVKAIIERKQGHYDAAVKLLDDLLKSDPLNHQARFERYLNTDDESDRNDFVGLITQEIPHETFIEIAEQYYNWNMYDEALLMLDLAPEHPMVQVWEAWLLKKTGHEPEAVDKLMLAVNESPYLVFPFRPEMVEIFSWANQVIPDWKWLYYEALICWQHNQLSLARSLFTECGLLPDYAPFYLAKARLFSDDQQVADDAVRKAFLLDPGSWRCSVEMAKLQVREQQIGKALQTAGLNYKLHPDNCVVGLHYANVLYQSNDYRGTLKILSRIEMLPAESDKWSGEIDSHSLFRAANIKCAIGQMQKGKWKKALDYLSDAETWPQNLGWGEPYFSDNRLTKFMAAYCYSKMSNSKMYNEAVDYIKSYRNPDQRTSSLENQLASLVSEGKNDFRSITRILISDHGKNREAGLLTEFLAIM